VKEAELDLMSTAHKAFQSIYRDHSWGGASKSGPGSDPELTRRYRYFLGGFLRARNVRRVVDLGCGDWASSRLIDWSGIDYLGLDVVPEIIEQNQRKFARPGIRFAVTDLANEELPPAELAICKEVLQHLPNVAVARILAKLPAYQMAILVNDSKGTSVGSWRTLWRGRPLGETNEDISPGGYRPIKLREAPFNLKARVLMRYRCGFGEYRWTKEVLLWTNPARS
jgi:SAM-dependent methyltransferase